MVDNNHGWGHGEVSGGLFLDPYIHLTCSQCWLCSSVYFTKWRPPLLMEQPAPLGPNKLPYLSVFNWRTVGWLGQREATTASENYWPVMLWAEVQHVSRSDLRLSCSVMQCLMLQVLVHHRCRVSQTNLDQCSRMFLQVIHNTIHNMAVCVFVVFWEILVCLWLLCNHSSALCMCDYLNVFWAGASYYSVSFGIQQRAGSHLLFSLFYVRLNMYKASVFPLLRRGAVGTSLCCSHLSVETCNSGREATSGNPVRITSFTIFMWAMPDLILKVKGSLHVKYWVFFFSMICSCDFFPITPIKQRQIQEKILLTWHLTRQVRR